MAVKLPTRLLGGLGKLLTVLAGVAVLIVTIAWLSGMFEEKIEPEHSQRSVRHLTNQATDEVHEVFKANIEEAMGTLKASNRTIVAAKVMATIQAVNVSAGEQVAVGDELIRLDDGELSARLKQANQIQEAAAARRLRAVNDFERISALYQQNAASRTEYDKALGDRQVAEADEERAKQTVQEAAVQLSYTKIVADKAGRIVDRLAEPGDLTQPGKPLLVLYDATSLRLEAPVNESLALELQLGQRVDVTIDATGDQYSATIDEIVPQADTPSRSFLVKASLPATTGLYEGMFGRLKIQTSERRHLCLATSAVIQMGQLDFVDVVLPDGTLERRLVKIGQLGMPGRQEVLSGVEAGDRVILHGEAEVPPIDPELAPEMKPPAPAADPNSASKDPTNDVQGRVS